MVGDDSAQSCQLYEIFHSFFRKRLHFIVKDSGFITNYTIIPTTPKDTTKSDREIENVYINYIKELAFSQEIIIFYLSSDRLRVILLDHKPRF